MFEKWRPFLFKIRTVLWVVGVVSILACGMVLFNPLWRVHAFNVFGRAWRGFLITEGSSTVGMLSNWASPVIAVGITIAVIRHHRGQLAMEQHWKEEAGLAARVVVMVALIMYGPVLIWKCVGTAYADHVALVSERNLNKQMRGCWMSNLGMKPPAYAPPGMQSGDVVVFWCATDYESMISIEWDFSKAPKRIGVPFFTDVAVFAANVQFSGLKAIAYINKPTLAKFQPVALDIFSDEQLSPQVTEITIRLLAKDGRAVPVVIHATDLR
jgi:hypothetical protein